MYVCYIIFTPFGYGVLFANNNFRIKIGGGWARGASNIFGTPYVYLQPLKLATSNLVHNLGLGLAYQKQRLGPKLAGVWARRASEKMWDPYAFLQPFKLAIQIWYTTWVWD